MSSGSKHLVGKSAKAKADFDGAFGAFCGLLRPNDTVNKSFLAYFFQAPFYKKHISEISKGTNINNLKREHILDLDFPYPPPVDQIQIVEKIEELFSELDKGIENLKTAQQQLKVYRQAVLKWAFEGKLTNENVKDGELPDGWEWKELGNIVDRVFDGPFGSSLKSDDYVLDGVRVIRLENIGILDFKDEHKTFVSEEKYLSLKKHTVSSGDIIFSSFIIEKVRVVILPSYIKFAINKADCFCIRVGEEGIDKNFLAYFLSTKNLYNQLINQVHGATRPRVNTKQLKSCLIPVCTLIEQRQIVEEIESRLSVCDKMEETITNSLQQAEALRQSILKKAFEGKLVKSEYYETA
jgi:type I restriction enzyme S subunit